MVWLSREFEVGDFLGNIAAQSLGRAQVVRPRPVSLFEPARETGAPAFTQPLERGAGSEVQEAVGAGHARERQAERDEEQGPPIEHFRGDVIGDSRGDDGSREESRPLVYGPDFVPAPLIQYPLVSSMENAPQSAPFQLTATPAPQVQVERFYESNERPNESIAEQAVAGPLMPSPAQAPLRDIPLQPRQTQSYQQQRKIEFKPAIERMVNEHPAYKDQGNEYPANQPGVNELHPLPGIARRAEDIQVMTQTSRRRTLGPGERMLAQSSASPSISVTIGRIEIRATPPTGPPQKKQAAPRPKGLDEYLRQRNEGGRR